MFLHSQTNFIEFYSLHMSIILLSLHFLSPAHEVGAGDIVITMSGRAAVYTDPLGGVDVPFGGFVL